MMARLPEPAGFLLDRTEPIAFRFEGKQYQGYRGDTVASALAANDVSVLSRSFKYHRPRGIHSLSGLDANTLVQVGPAPNRFADREPLSPDLEVMGQTTGGRSGTTGWPCSACCTASSPWASTTRRSTSRAGLGRSGPR